eukprot:COSAG06_NODE_786_length_12305_cov_9.158774_2_plen_172_part_00
MLPRWQGTPVEPSLWGSSLRAPSVAGDLPPPHRRTGLPQPPATLLPPDRAQQACGPAARPARRSAAPQQQHQPSLRAAASSSAEHGQIRRPIFLPRPGHTVMATGRRRARCSRACLSPRKTALAEHLASRRTDTQVPRLTRGQVVIQNNRGVDSTTSVRNINRSSAADPTQ